MWCPSVSLSVWANAWLAGHAAPDDVLDALSAWAPTQSVLAYDAVAAGRTGLPWPDVDEAGPMSLLQTLRFAATSRSRRPERRQPDITVLQPVPGDVRGLPVGSQFAADALAAGEAITVGGPDGGVIGLVPAFECDDSDFDGESKAGAGDSSPDPGMLSWSVYSLPRIPAPLGPDLGEAEYALRSAVRSAAESLGRLRLAGGAEDDPRALVEEVLQASSHHRLPDHAPSRAVRVLATAAHIDAIVTVSTGLTPIGIQSSSEVRIADDAMRPLIAVVRDARAAAVTAILQSAWDDHEGRES